MEVGIKSLLVIIFSTILAQISLFYILRSSNIPKWFDVIISVVSTMLIVLGLAYMRDFLLSRSRPVIYEVICLFSYIIVQLIFAFIKRKK